MQLKSFNENPSAYKVNRSLGVATINISPNKKSTGAATISVNPVRHASTANASEEDIKENVSHLQRPKENVSHLNVRKVRHM